MSGVLVFVAQGTASQIVVGLLVSITSSGLYIHWRPFEEESDDDLAIITQASLFLTLLAALLKKVEVDKTDSYNQVIFSTILIVVNCSGITLIILSQLTKPIQYMLEGIFGKRQKEEATLKGLAINSNQESFIEHFLNVAKSSAEEGGWKIYVRRTEKWSQLLDYSGAVIERRCSNSVGAIDEIRAVFVVHCNFEMVKSWVLNDGKDLRHGVVEIHDIGAERGNRKSTDKNIEYQARKMKGGFFSNRDYLLRCFEGRGEDGGWYCLKKSVESKNMFSLKRSKNLGRIRANALYEGWLLHDLGEAVRVTYVENVDPGGLMKGYIIDKIMPALLRDKIDDLLAHIDEERLKSMFGVFEGGQGEEGLEMSVVTANTGNAVLGSGGARKSPIASKAMFNNSRQKNPSQVEGQGKLEEGGLMARTSKFNVANPLRGAPMAAGVTSKTATQNKAEKGRPNSSFDTFKNANLVVRGKGGSKKNKKNISKEPPKRKSIFAIPKDKLEEAPTGPPKIPPPPTLDDDDIGPPPFPPPSAESSPPQQKPVCQWTEEWDAESGAIYYLNADGETSTWDMPEDFWRDE